MKISPYLKYGAAGALFIGASAAPALAPYLAPEAIPFIPAGVGAATTLGGILVGPDVWTSWRDRRAGPVGGPPSATTKRMINMYAASTDKPASLFSSMFKRPDRRAFDRSDTVEIDIERGGDDVKSIESFEDQIMRQIARVYDIPVEVLTDLPKREKEYSATEIYAAAVKKHGRLGAPYVRPEGDGYPTGILKPLPPFEAKDLPPISPWVPR